MSEGYCPDHPDIRAMELCGEIDSLYGDAEEIIGECCVCGDEICGSEEHYDVHDDIVCWDCNLEYMNQFRKVGA